MNKHYFGMVGALVLTGAAAVVAAPSVAQAEVAFVRGQFTDRVEAGMPAGDASAARAARAAVYWMEIRNTGPAVAVTLVWRVGGREVGRQTLDVGRAPRWRTWGTWRVRGGSAVEVQVLGADGATLHSEQLAGR